MRILVDEWAVSMGMLTACKSIGEGGMTGSQIEETVTCTRLGSSSALSFVFCWHRSKENATYCFVFTTLPQCSEDMALTLTKGTSYPMTWHCTSCSHHFSGTLLDSYSSSFHYLQ